MASILGDSSEEVKDEEKNDEEEQEYDDQEEEEEEEEFATSTSSPKVYLNKNRPLEDFSSLNIRFSSQIYKVFIFIVIIKSKTNSFKIRRLKYVLLLL